MGVQGLGRSAPGSGQVAQVQGQQVNSAGRGGGPSGPTSPQGTGSSSVLQAIVLKSLGGMLT
jgi:hypothetical protein